MELRCGRVGLQSRSYEFEDFTPQQASLAVGGKQHLEADEGRSSSKVLPFFNVEGQGGGVIVAVGWSGDWTAEFANLPGGMCVKAGMTKTHLLLHPGEKIRSPRMLALAYNGDRWRGQNLLRRFILAHHRQVRSLDDTRVVMLNSGLEQFVPRKGPVRDFGALCNPGSTAWEDTLSDEHRYQRVPHLPQHIRDLRDHQPGKPVFLSEYGVGSAVDLPRQLRHYEQIGLGQSEDAELYRGFYNFFLADWKKWNMADTFGTPENYFRQATAKMAALRLTGLNALRANPACVGHSMTGTYDHGSCGEGATGTEFRDLKPGAADALFDGFYPLRLCLITEPYHAYRGAKVQLKAVVANEDALLPGEYPIRLHIIEPDNSPVFEKTVSVKIQDPKTRPEQPMAIPIFEEDVAMNGPTGKYQFLAAFEKGGAAAGGTVDFYVTDAAEMPKVETDVALWGDEPVLAKWIADRGLRAHPLAADRQATREVIVVGRKPGAGDAAGWRALARHVARGSTAIFLAPQVFQKDKDKVGWAPLANKGRIGAKASWLNTSFTYDSGTLVSVYGLGAGRFILNTLGICDRLGEDPAAERLLRNMIRYAASHSEDPPADLPPSFDEQLKAMGY